MICLTAQSTSCTRCPAWEKPAIILRLWDTERHGIPPLVQGQRREMDMLQGVLPQRQGWRGAENGCRVCRRPKGMAGWDRAVKDNH